MLSMDDLIALVGLPLTSPDVRAVLRTCLRSPPLFTNDDRAYYPNKSAGVCLMSNEPEDPKTTPNRVDAIFVYLKAEDGYTPFAGDLTRGLSKDHSLEDVRTLWGEPTRSAPELSVSGARFVEWVRCDSGWVCIHLRLEQGTLGIRRITLMSPAIAR